MCETSGFRGLLGAWSPWASWRGHRGLPSLLIHGEPTEGRENEFCFYSSASDAGVNSTGDEETQLQKDEPLSGGEPGRWQGVGAAQSPGLWPPPPLAGQLCSENCDGWALHEGALTVTLKSLSRVRLFATRGLWPTRLLRLWDFPG